MTRSAIGILMLETQFPRPLGDIGNAGTWDFPVHMHAVSGASATKVVLDDPRGLFDAFVAAGRSLIDQGCRGLTTSCGFLSLMQDDLKHALGVPFASSPLMQLPMVEALLPPGQQAAVLTISKDTLSPAHLTAAGARADTLVDGPPRDGSFASTIFTDSPQMDVAACRQEMIAAGQAMIAANPTIGAIVLECTNMAPFAADVAQATERPVYSVVSFLNWFQAGLAPPRF